MIFSTLNRFYTLSPYRCSQCLDGDLLVFNFDLVALWTDNKIIKVLGFKWQFSTWVGSPKKAPTSLKNTLFSPHFTQVLMTCGGLFWGANPSGKLAVSIWHMTFHQLLKTIAKYDNFCVLILFHTFYVYIYIYVCNFFTFKCTDNTDDKILTVCILVEYNQIPKYQSEVF